MDLVIETLFAIGYFDLNLLSHSKKNLNEHKRKRKHKHVQMYAILSTFTIQLKRSNSITDAQFYWVNALLSYHSN